MRSVDGLKASGTPLTPTPMKLSLFLDFYIRVGLTNFIEVSAKGIPDAFSSKSRFTKIHYDGLVKSLGMMFSVIPTKVGIQLFQ